jgi:hypothetical protein
MTEAEWLASADPTAMLWMLSDAASNRKLQLFTAACCRRVHQHYGSIWELEHADLWLAVLERSADGVAEPNEWDRALELLRQKRNDIKDRTEDMLGAHFCAFLCAIAIDDDAPSAALWASVNANIALSDFPRRPEVDEVAGSPESKIQAPLLRDIFGNPFRPISFPAAWRTDTALSLAQQMYDSRDFGAMPILADAIEDAGCENEDILSHCRDTSLTHVRGCWVVDLVLGK